MSESFFSDVDCKIPLTTPGNYQARKDIYEIDREYPRLLRTVFLKADGKTRCTNKWGFAEISYQYDAEGRLNGFVYYDESGKKTDVIYSGVSDLMTYFFKRFPKLSTMFATPFASLHVEYQKIPEVVYEKMAESNLSFARVVYRESAKVFFFKLFLKIFSCSPAEPVVLLT